MPRPGCSNVQVKVLLRADDVFLALLRFAPDGTIDEHAADHEIDVICLEGRGRTSVGETALDLRAGERVRWPAGGQHRLWTEDSMMVTLMVERPGSGT